MTDGPASRYSRHMGRYPAPNRFVWLLGVVCALVPLVSGSPATTAQTAGCANYDSQIWAQSVFDTDPAFYQALDPDGNGVACENLSSGAAPAWWTSRIPEQAEPAALVAVTDGDTIRVEVGGQVEPVRLILIDAPETNDPNRPAECFGQEATAYLAWLLSLGGTIYLEADVTNRDQYGRLLRYAWLDFGDGEVYQVNEAMVRAGYAAFATFPPDLKYVEEMREAGSFAREHGYGLWSGCQTDDTGDTNELSEARGIVSNPPPAAPPVAAARGCDPAYPGVCIASPPPDLDCGDVPHRRFDVVPPDPHRFDGDADGIGCERD